MAGSRRILTNALRWFEFLRPLDFERGLHMRGSALNGVILCLHLFTLLSSSFSQVTQEKPSALDLIRLAKSGSPELARTVSQAFNATELQSGTAARGHLSSFFFAIETPSKPVLVIDGAPGPELH